MCGRGRSGKGAGRQSSDLLHVFKVLLYLTVRKADYHPPHSVNAFERSFRSKKDFVFIFFKLYLTKYTYITIITTVNSGPLCTFLE